MSSELARRITDKVMLAVYRGTLPRDDFASAIDAELAGVRNAYADMHMGWRYIRMRHGDLDGVAWNRCETSTSTARKDLELTPATQPRPDGQEE